MDVDDGYFRDAEGMVHKVRRPRTGLSRETYCGLPAPRDQDSGIRLRGCGTCSWNAAREGVPL